MSYFNQANKLYQSRDYETAISYYQKSIYQDVHTACSYFNIGVCLIKLGKFDEAITALKNAIELQPESKYYFNLGYCYSQKNINNKALRLFNIAWSMCPEDDECERAVDITLSRLKKEIS